MILLTQLLGYVVASLFAISLWKLYRGFSSPLRRIHGPKPTSLLGGNMVEFLTEPNDNIEKWVKEYGKMIRINGMFFDNWLLTVDTRAITHVLTHASNYQRPLRTRSALSHIFGNGLLVAEGDEHRNQRRALNPAFGVAQIRQLTDIFVEKSTQFCEVLSSEINKDHSAAVTGTRIDMLSWLNKLTLDIIGLAGFNYNFDALGPDEKQNEFQNAFLSISGALSPSKGIGGIFLLLQLFIPPLRLIPTNTARKIRAGHRTVWRIGSELLADAKLAARVSVTEKGEIEKKTFQGRDLLSLLVKANVATDIPDSQRLSDADVIAQIITFLGAGVDTTSTGLSWALFALSSNHAVQAKLREELLSVNTVTPSMDDLMALPYLDAVVREALRLYAPIVVFSRIALKDDELPVEKPFTDRYGVTHNTIKIRKGDTIVVPLLEINRSEDIWGSDSREFKPERWEKLPEAVSGIPGILSHLTTFSTGARACIGYRFAVVQMKAILFFLVRTFEFDLAVPVEEIGWKTVVVQYPVVRSDPTGTSQLPLLVKPYRGS